MAESEKESIVKPIKKFRKGDLVKVNKEAYKNSLEVNSSDPESIAYLFEGPGELLTVKGDYSQIRWRRPVPDVWLRNDQLEIYE